MKTTNTPTVASDWTELFEDYKGEWVTLAANEKTVLTHGDNASVVFREAIQKGCDKPILFKVPAQDLAYIGIA